MREEQLIQKTKSRQSHIEDLAFTPNSEVNCKENWIFFHSSQKNF
jgi:hypothetical protein